MELRRRRSPTPPVSVNSDPHAPTARRSSRRVSMIGSPPGLGGSVSSQSSSVHDQGNATTGVASSEDAAAPHERAPKRPKLSASGKSSTSQASAVSIKSRSSPEGSRRSSRKEDRPVLAVAGTTPPNKRTRRESQPTLDEIVVNMDNAIIASSAVQSPETESPTIRSRAVKSPLPQKATETANRQRRASRLSNNGSIPDRHSPRTGDQTNGIDSTSQGASINHEQDTTEDSPTKRGLDQPDNGLSSPRAKAATQTPGNSRLLPTASTSSHAANESAEIGKSRSGDLAHDARSNGTHAMGANGTQQAVLGEEDDTADQHIDKADDNTANRQHNGLEDSREVDNGGEEDIEDDDDDAEADDDTGDVEEGEEDGTAGEGDDDDDDNDDDAVGEEEEEEEDDEEDPISDQSKADDDDGASRAESALEDESPSKAALPKIITTLVPALRVISEEDAEVAQSPLSGLGDDAVNTGIGKLPRKLPGRRRAPHPIPKVEAALRRQLQLRIRYRAVAKQLKPILAELAKRSIKDLKNDAEAHLKAREHQIVKQGLEDKLQARLARNKVENDYNRDKLQLLLDSETEKINMGYRQAKANAVDTFTNRIKYDFLMAVRKHNMAEDEHASDDVSGDMITSLYHVNVHGRRTHILNDAHDSRSRRIIETDRLFDELCLRKEVCDEDIPEDAENLHTRPGPFTYFDPTDREANEHDRRLDALIRALTVASEEKPNPPSPRLIPNSEAVNLQVLADASSAGPPPKAASTKPTMASLLNSEEQDTRPSHPTAADNKHLSEVYQSSAHRNEVSAPEARLLPAFSDARGTSREVVLKKEPIDAPLVFARYSSSVESTQQSGQVGGTSTYAATPVINARSLTPQVSAERSSWMQQNGSSSPEKRGRRESLSRSKLNPSGPAGSPESRGLIPAPIQSIPDRPTEHNTNRPPLPRDYRDHRSQEHRSLPPFLMDSTRNRSISDSYGSHMEQDHRRPSEQGRGAGPNPLPMFGRYDHDSRDNRDAGYDALLRRSTISAVDAQRFTPSQGHMPPQPHRANTVSSMQSSGAGPPPTDRYGRPIVDNHGHHMAPPPFSGHFSQGPLPPIPTGLPPPPAPSLGAPFQYPPPPLQHSGQGPPPPSTMQPGHYGPPSSFGRPPPPYPGREQGFASSFLGPPPPPLPPGPQGREMGGQGRNGSLARDGRHYYR